VRNLPIVFVAMIAGLALANGGALLAIARGLAEPAAAPAPAMRIALIAAAVALLVLAPLLETLIRGRGIPPAAPRSPAATYVAAKVASAALREAGGLVGMVLGLITGEMLWPALFGGLAITSLLLAWPRADERERAAREVPEPN
jgi:hypothetical protein